MSRVYFTVATNKEMKGALNLKKTLGKPLIIIGEKDIKATNDPLFMDHKMAVVSNMLLKDHDEVVGIAPNLVIGGEFEKDFEGEFDAVVFRNAKPPVLKAVWDVKPDMYVTRDFFFIRSKEFAREWLAMCFKPFVKNYSGKEEDVLNMLVYYGNYKCKIMAV